MVRTARNAGLALFLGISAAWAEPLTIAALGDSLTQGYGLPPNEGFVPRLEAWLEAEGADVDIINAGVSGDTTAGGLSRIEWTLTPEVDALIVALGGNDVLRGIDPYSSGDNLHEILEIAKSRDIPVLLVGIEAPANYGPEFKAVFDGIFPRLSNMFDTLLYPNFIGALTGMEDRNSALESYFQPDRIHPNADGVELIVEDMGPSVLDLVARAQD